METKLYIRDGKRFKYVPNMLGMYWNGIILTKEKMQDSIAVVIEQHYDHVIMASLEISKPMSWNDAKEWCKNCFYNGRLPLNTELINLKKYINTDTIHLHYIWGEEHSCYNAWLLRWSDGATNYGTKSSNYYVNTIAVKDVSILDLI